FVDLDKRFEQLIGRITPQRAARVPNGIRRRTTSGCKVESTWVVWNSYGYLKSFVCDSIGSGARIVDRNCRTSDGRVFSPIFGVSEEQDAVPVKISNTLIVRCHYFTVGATLVILILATSKAHINI